MKSWTIRVRLTVLYGSFFFVAGALLLGVTYLLVERSLDRRADASPGLVASLPNWTTTARNDEQTAETIRGLIEDQQRFQNETMDSLLTQGSIALVGVGVLAVAFGWLLAGRVLQPLQRITETAQRIAGAEGVGRGLHERIALAGPRDEVKRLADTFDLMLERLDRSFDGQRRFVANASHELRTPLAMNRALVELAITRADVADETRQLGEALLGVNERHERLIEGLLVLADAENEIGDRSLVDLSDIARHILGHTTVPAVQQRQDLHPATTSGDPILLERLTHNLLENGARHNVAGGWVSVSTTTTPGWAVLTVTNTGPIVPVYEVETLFQPFRRLRGERIGGGRGFGLGLSIVRAIARAHGGTATAVPRDGGGLTVTVLLPFAAPVTR
ncbi:sensor histidine kinase [Virgisporangium aurantiacum]|uniref:histidine kinase n=1 Tax=Virgisporangium aurantiacum TaxID=175570 RepID=A0A8J4EAB8_9ACTN|nr:HAMP domain-containing sensor histidine kinase [Virgisporangium aurantiacum]GIJ64617.1 sensor protein CutS [Virgisporangium aurantiacum]